jgi:glycerol 3-phosphatase-2
MPRSEIDIRGTVVVDLDGVVYRGNEGLPGAGTALQAMADAGWRLVMATNNSSTTPADVVAKIHRLTGYAQNVNRVVTSSLAAASHLEGTCGTALVVGEASLVAAIESVGIDVVDAWQEAEVVVVGVDFAISYRTMERAANAIRAGARFIATNTDATFPIPGGLAIGSGAIVAAIATAAGSQPTVCGKPERPMRQLIRQHLVGPDIWVVGDRPETDIAMAMAEDWRSILPLTGVTTSGADGPLSHAPDFVVPSISDVPQILARHASA